MKRTIVIAFIIFAILCVLFSSCTRRVLKLHAFAEEMLDCLEITQSYIISLNYDSIKQYDITIQVTVEDINLYLSRLIGTENPIEELSDDFVQTNTSFKNVDEYLDYIRTYIFLFKEQELYETHKNNFVNDMISSSVFSINSEDVVKYGAYIAKTYEDVAVSVGLSLEDYYSQQMFSKDAFFNRCYLEAEYEIKRFLIVGALAEIHSISITNEEIETEFQKYGYDDSYIADNPDKAIFIKYNLLETKTIQTLIYGKMISNQN